MSIYFIYIPSPIIKVKVLYTLPHDIFTTKVTVTDLINRIVQVLRGDLYWFKISTQDTGLMEPVKP